MRHAHVRAVLSSSLLSFLACTPERGAMNANPGPAELENVEWKLVELDGAAVPDTPPGAPTLTLSSKEDRARGFAGCNRYTGGYELEGASLRFTAIATTRMACPDPTPEASLLKALSATASWKVGGRTLELYDATPTLRARWTVTAIESGEGS